METQVMIHMSGLWASSDTATLYTAAGLNSLY